MLNASQITLADAVAEIENFSDDCQLFIRDFYQMDSVIFPVSENDQELLTCTVLSESPLEPQTILEQMSKKEILSMLTNNGYSPAKNMLKKDLIQWSVENIADIKSTLPNIVRLSISPYAHKIWRKLFTYLQRKYEWKHSYLESEERGLEEIFIPEGSERIGPLTYSFPDDEITSLLNLYGHNRCLNGFVAHPQDVSSEKNRRKFAGMNFAVTGAFDNVTRAEISAIILNHGGCVNEWITKNTSYLVVGYRTGSKLQKAKAKGVPLLSEKEFFDLIDDD